MKDQVSGQEMMSFLHNRRSSYCYAEFFDGKSGFVRVDGGMVGDMLAEHGEPDYINVSHYQSQFTLYYL